MTVRGWWRGAGDVRVGVVRVGVVLVGVVVVGVVVAGPAGPAHAQPADTPVPGHRVGPIIAEIQAEQDAVAVGGDLLSAVLGEDVATATPWSHYDLGASVGPLDKVSTLLARMLFALGRWAVGLCHFLVGWVLHFDLGRILAEPAALLATTYQERIIGPFRLTELALLLAVAHGAWVLLRHHTAGGVAEVGVAFAIAAASSAVMAAPARAVCDGLDLLGGTTQAILALAGDVTAAEPDRPDLCADDPSAGGRAARSTDGFRAAVVSTFLVDPHLVLQWGAVPPDGACRTVAEALVSRGAWRDEDFPRDRMADAGCHGMVAFNEEMGADRLVGTVAYVLAAVAFAVAVVAVVGMLLLAQVGGAVLVLALPFALVAGVAPGAGREVLARWGHALLRVALLFVGSAFLLVMMVTGVEAVAEQMAEEPVALRMGASAGVAWALVLLRRQGFTSLRGAARGVAARVAGPAVDVGPVGRAPGTAVARAVQGVEGSVTSARMLSAHASAAAGLVRRVLPGGSAAVAAAGTAGGSTGPAGADGDDGGGGGRAGPRAGARPGAATASGDGSAGAGAAAAGAACARVSGRRAARPVGAAGVSGAGAPGAVGAVGAGRPAGARQAARRLGTPAGGAVSAATRQTTRPRTRAPGDGAGSPGGAAGSGAAGARSRVPSWPTPVLAGAGPTADGSRASLRRLAATLEEEQTLDRRPAGAWVSRVTGPVGDPAARARHARSPHDVEGLGVERAVHAHDADHRGLPAGGHVALVDLASHRWRPEGDRTGGIDVTTPAARGSEPLAGGTGAHVLAGTGAGSGGPRRPRPASSHGPSRGPSHGPADLGEPAGHTVGAVRPPRPVEPSHRRELSAPRPVRPMVAGQPTAVAVEAVGDAATGETSPRDVDGRAPLGPPSRGPAGPGAGPSGSAAGRGGRADGTGGTS